MRIAVVGLGAVGSQTLLHLSRMEGTDVTGIEQFGPGHAFGASGGENRLFHTVPFQYRNQDELISYSLSVWESLEQTSGRDLLRRTGHLAVVEPGTPASERVLGAAEQLRDRIRVLDSAELREQFGFQTYQDTDVGVFDPGGGAVRTDATIFEAVRASEASGARVLKNARVTAIDPRNDGVRVRVGDRDLGFDVAVVTTGPWAKELVPSIEGRLRVHRPASAWFLPRDAGVLRGMPVLSRDGEQQFYAAPTFDGTALKVGYGGIRQTAVEGAPQPVDAVVDPTNLGEFPAIMRDCLTGFDPDPIRMARYFEGYTESTRPIVEYAHPRLLVGVGFSGRGFKLSPAYGRYLAESARRGEPVSAYFSEA